MPFFRLSNKTWLAGLTSSLVGTVIVFIFFCFDFYSSLLTIQSNAAGAAKRIDFFPEELYFFPFLHGGCAEPDRIDRNYVLLALHI
jgi:hypothetical protein